MKGLVASGADRGADMQRGEAAPVFCVAESGSRAREHTLQGPRPQLTGVRQGGVRDGTGHPPRHECPFPRSFQVEPQHEDRLHTRDCVPDSFPGSHESGGTGEKGSLPQGFLNYANHCY